MKIAIVGAGFCGLALGWHLSKDPHAKITIFDPNEIGASTSGIAAGMLHPFAGAHSKLNWRGYEGLKATSELLAAAEKALQKQISWQRGMLRLAISEEQRADFSLCAQQHSDVRWYSEDECQTLVEGLSTRPGIFIPSAISVDCSNYLKGLWLACTSRNVCFNKSMVNSLEDLKDFDQFVIAAGIGTKVFPGMDQLGLKPIKGQILQFKWPNDKPPLPFPLNSQAYLLMSRENQSCFAGATFEKGADDFESDIEIAKSDILPKIRAFFPLIDQLPLIDCRVGVRVSTPGHKPIVKQISDRGWLLTGMGSKGLLYHALFAKELSENILAD